jgi:hypothetical protein
MTLKMAKRSMLRETKEQQVETNESRKSSVYTWVLMLKLRRM